MIFVILDLQILVPCVVIFHPYIGISPIPQMIGLVRACGKASHSEFRLSSNLQLHGSSKWTVSEKEFLHLATGFYAIQLMSVDVFTCLHFVISNLEYDLISVMQTGLSLRSHYTTFSVIGRLVVIAQIKV